VGVQGSTQHRRAKHCQLQGRRHLAATTRGPTHPGTPRAADHTDVDPENCKNSIGLRAAVGPMLAIIHRHRARRLRLQPRQHHRQRDAKGRSEIGRDGAWVRREQSQCSRDPPAHFREAPIRRYSGCPQPFPSSAGSPNAHAMLLGRKIPTAAPHWKDRSTSVDLSTQYVRALGKTFEAGGQPVKNREMRSLAQRGNQAKFFHRMPGIQRSPVAYNLQHLREYNSCRIWASQSRRPRYVADVEGRARIEGVAASIHESYGDGVCVCCFVLLNRYWGIVTVPVTRWRKTPSSRLLAW